MLSSKCSFCGDQFNSSDMAMLAEEADLYICGQCLCLAYNSGIKGVQLPPLDAFKIDKRKGCIKELLKNLELIKSSHSKACAEANRLAEKILAAYEAWDPNPVVTQARAGHSPEITHEDLKRMKAELGVEDLVCSFCEGAYADRTLIHGPSGNICGHCLGICLNQIYSPKSDRRMDFPRVHFDLHRFEDPGQIEIILERLLFIENNDHRKLYEIDGYTEGVYDAIMSDMKWLERIPPPPHEDNTPAQDPDPDLPDIVA